MDAEQRAQLWDEALELNSFARIAVGIDNEQTEIALDVQRDLLERIRDANSSPKTLRASGLS